MSARTVCEHEYSESDRGYMTQALMLAQRVKGTTFPNPAVGAVVVSRGQVVGRGATSAAGGPHAEIVALKQASGRASGGSLYVTLEPCCHWGRTGPCTDAIIAAGITRVFLAVRDPNPLVAGRGIRLLRRRGIEVRVGLHGDQAHRINEDFFWSIVHNRPWVSLKLAMTLDGRIADMQDRSRWITSPQARAFGHLLRSRHAAVAVGRGTLLKDDPLLTVRNVKGPSPARVVFTTTPRIPDSCRLLLDAPKLRTVLVCSGKKTGKPVVSRADGIEVWYTGTRDRARSVERFLQQAHEQGLSSILVEGGQGLASVMMEQHFVNRVYLVYGGSILGNGRAGFLFNNGLSMDSRIHLDDMEVGRLGADILVTGIPRWGV